jgi:hypothetical protein
MTDETPIDIDPDGDYTAQQELATALGELFESKSGRYYGLIATDIPVEMALDRMRHCQLCLSPPMTHHWLDYLPFRTRTRPNLLMTHREVAQFSNPAAGLHSDRLQARETETVAMFYRDAPTDVDLTPYRNGAVIGRPYGNRLALEDTTPAPVALPPAQRRKHTVIVANSGEGKTVLADQLAIDSAHDDGGPVFVFDPKGGMGDDIARTMYVETDSLDGVEVLDFAEVMPRLPLLDLRQLQAAAPMANREAIVDNVVQDALWAIETAAAQADDADSIPPKSKDLIDLLIRTRFARGQDTIDIETILEDLKRYKNGEPLPTTDNPALDSYVRTVTEEDSQQVKTGIAGGAFRLLQFLFDDATLTTPIGSPPDDQRQVFDLEGSLTEDTLYVFDFGSLNDAKTSFLSQLVISRLWRLSKATDDTPLADLIVDEAYALTASGMLQDIIGRGRGHNLGLTLLTQGLSKVDGNLTQTIRDEIGTVIAGAAGESVTPLFEPATEAAHSTQRLLASIRGTEWLCRLKPDRDSDPLPAFLVRERPLPAGHHAAETVTAAVEADYQSARDNADAVLEARPDIATRRSSVDSPADRSTIAAGLETTLQTAPLPSGVSYDDGTLACATCGKTQSTSFTGVKAATRCCQDEFDPDNQSLPVVDIHLDASVTVVENSDYTIEELQFLRLLERAHHGDIPRDAFDLRTDTMTTLRNEVGLDSDAVAALASPGTIPLDADDCRRLAESDAVSFEIEDLQALWHTDDIALTRADLTAIIEAADLDVSAEAIDATSAETAEEPTAFTETQPRGLIYKHEGRGNYYSLTPLGWSVLAMVRGESVTATAARGPSHRHISESILHLRWKEIAEHWLIEHHRENPDSPVTTVDVEYSGPEGMIDVVGLTDDGSVHVAIEAERDNDLRGDAPADYDAMAACDPDIALWVVRNRRVTHRLLAALSDPRDGAQRVTPPLPGDKDSLEDVSEQTQLDLTTLSAPGCTDIRTYQSLLAELSI